MKEKFNENRFSDLDGYYNGLTAKILDQKHVYLVDIGKYKDRINEIANQSEDLEKQIKIIIDEIRKLNKKINHSNDVKSRIISHYNTCIDARIDWNEQFKMGLINKDKCYELNVNITEIMKSDRQKINREDKKIESLNAMRKKLKATLAKLKDDLKSLANEKKSVDKDLKNAKENTKRCDDNLSRVAEARQNADKSFLTGKLKPGSLEPSAKKMKTAKENKAKTKTKKRK